MGIEYRDIPGFPGYRAGEDGSVWSCRAGQGWKQLSPQRNYGGYLFFTPRRGGKSVSRLAHRLVLESFKGACPPGHQCLHVNGDRTDNRLENLRWGTPKENGEDRSAHGSVPRGEKNRSARLTSACVEEIRRLAAAGVPLAELASRYPVSLSQISRIVSLRSWKHL